MNVSSVNNTYHNYMGNQQTTSNSKDISSNFIDDLLKKNATQATSGADKVSISAEARKMLENDSRANQQGGSVAREAWMPDRLEEPLTRYILLPRSHIKLGSEVAELLYETEIVSSSPKWYEDLAVANHAQDEDIVNEYHGYLKEAMNQALDEEVPYDESAYYGGPDDKSSSNMTYYEALVEDSGKSESVRQSVMENLAKNPRATELMKSLGIE